MKRGIQLMLTLAIVSVSSVSCFDPPSYSTTPELSFNSTDKFTVADSFSGTKKDSVVITINYKDGDGDLGESDTTQFKKYKDWGNYELKTKALINGQFQDLPLSANSRIFFPDLKFDRRKGPIEGKLNYSQFYYYSKSAKNTVIKYQIRVRDRSQNISNIIETDTMTVPLVR